MSKIKVGQIWKEKVLPSWRKNDSDIFTIATVSFNKLSIIYNDGKTDYVTTDWVDGDCELIAEYPTWQEAVNSKEFKDVEED